MLHSGMGPDPSSTTASPGAGSDARPGPRPGHVPREARYVTIFRVARLFDAQGVDHLCRIRNLSTGGLMMESSAPLRAGQPVRVELRNLHSVTGTVAWAQHFRIGIAFHTPADVVGLLQADGARDSGAPAPRSPRFRTDCAVVVRRDGRIRRATLIDLSQHGAKLRATGLAADDQLRLSLPGIGTCAAVVRWVGGDEVGIVFHDAISFAELDRWLQDPAVRFGTVQP